MNHIRGRRNRISKKCSHERVSLLSLVPTQPMLTHNSQVDILSLRYKSVNFGSRSTSPQKTKVKFPASSAVGVSNYSQGDILRPPYRRCAQALPPGSGRMYHPRMQKSWKEWPHESVTVRSVVCTEPMSCDPPLHFRVLDSP